LGNYLLTNSVIKSYPAGNMPTSISGDTEPSGKLGSQQQLEIQSKVDLKSTSKGAAEQSDLTEEDRGHEDEGQETNKDGKYIHSGNRQKNNELGIMDTERLSLSKKAEKSSFRWYI
jgi:hypothetical protein